MTHDITIINQKYEHIEIDQIIKENESLEAEVKRLRKDRDLLLEQMSLLKKFSDGLWDRLKVSL